MHFSYINLVHSTRLDITPWTLGKHTPRVIVRLYSISFLFHKTANYSCFTSLSSAPTIFLIRLIYDSTIESAKK